MMKFYRKIRAAFLIAALLAGCGKNLSTDLLAPTALSLYPPSITLTAHTHATYYFSGKGGSAPYSYSLVSGPGSIDSSSGIYTQGTAVGSTSLQVTDSTGAKSTAVVNSIPVTTNGSLTSVAVDSSGNQYLAGNFTAIYPTSAPYGIMLSAQDGSPALAFDLQSGFNGQVNAVVTLSDGSFIFGGNFTTYQGKPAPYLAKVSAVGALDTNFNPSGTGFNSVVQSLALSGNSVFVGGLFTSYHGSTANHVAKLDTASGALDTTFDPSGTGFNAAPTSLIVVDAALFAAGGFTNYRGSTANYIAKLDTTQGSLDLTFNPSGTGFNAAAATLAISGTTLFVGGSFTTYRGSTANRIAKLDTTSGTLDTTFNASGTGFNAAVVSLVQSGTTLFVGGSFTTYRGSSANSVAKLDTSAGTLDATFDPSGTGFNSSPTSLAIFGTSLYVVGGFSTYRGATAQHIAKMDMTNGTLDSTFNAGGVGFNSSVAVIAISGANLFVGGNFTTYQGSVARNIAKLAAPNSTFDTTFAAGGAGFSGSVNTILVSGSSLYVGGAFSSYRGSPALSIAKLDLVSGNLDSTFDPGGAGFNNTVYALVVSGANLFAGGTFTNYRGSAANYVAKMDTTNGTLDTTFNPSGTGFNNGVFALVVSGSDLFTSGAFTTYRGTTANYLAKMDTTNGTLDVTFDPSGTGLNFYAYALAVSGGSLYIGGSFTTYRGATANHIAKVDTTNGTLDVAFDVGGTGPNGTVNTLVVSGTDLFVGGSFTTYQFATTNYLAKMDLVHGTKDVTFSTQGSGLDSNVTALAVAGSKLYVGGSFMHYSGGPFYAYGVLDTTSGAEVF